MSHNWRGFYALGRKRLTTRFSSMPTRTLQRRLLQWSRYHRHSRCTHRLQGNCSFKLGKGITYLSTVCHLMYEKGMQRLLRPRTLSRPLVTNFWFRKPNVPYPPITLFLTSRPFIHFPDCVSLVPSSYQVMRALLE